MKPTCLIRLPMTAALLALVCFTAAAGQTDKFKLPLENQPLDFSNIVGHYDLKVTATPTDVCLGQPILLKISIISNGDIMQEYKPQRRHLKIIRPEITKHFFVEPLPKRDHFNAATKTWEFWYQLLPKNAGVKSIPYMWLSYCHYPPRKTYQRRYAGEIAITVKKRPRVISAPKRMYNIAKGDTILARRNDSFWQWLLWVIGMLATPLGCWLWLRVWQAVYPTETERLKRRRSRAARRALKLLNRLPPHSPPERTAAAVVGYFHDRLGLQIAEPTPTEIESHLRGLALADDAARRAADFLQLCQRNRFAPPDLSGKSDVRAQAIQLIEELEKAA